MLRFRIPATVEVEPQLRRLLDRHCRRQVRLSMSDVAQDAAREVVYQVKFFNDRDREALLASLREDFRAHDTRLMLQEATAEY